MKGGMPDEIKEYAIAVVKTSVRTDEPNNYADVAGTGFPDEKVAVRAMNRWLAKTVNKHNACLGDHDPDRWYTETGVISTEYWPTKGYIFAIKNGKRENQVEIYIIDMLPYKKNAPLPDMEEYLNY